MAYTSMWREEPERGFLARLVDSLRSFWLGEKSSSDPTTAAYFGSTPSGSGVVVNEYTALNYSAYWAGVQLISGAIASLPLFHYKRLPNGGKERYPSSRVYRLIHDNFSPEHTAMLARETMQAHVLTWGNAYAEIERSQSGEPLALWPLTPDTVRPERATNGEVVYRVKQVTGPDALVPYEDMLHIPGLSYDGLIGYSVVRKAREAIGLGLATEQFGATFFGNGAWPGIVAQHPGKLTKEAHARLKDSFNDALQGGKPHSLIVTEEGIKVEKMGIPPDDAQFLSTRAFQVTEIARWLNLPPHKLRDLTHATFSNIEEQNIEFVVDTLRPWLVRWEQELNRKLIRPLEQTLQFTEHLVDGLLRGASEKRAAYYTTAINWGWLSANDVRRLENMNPIGPEGDLYLVPLNMQPAKLVEATALANVQAKTAPALAPAPPDAPDDAAADRARHRHAQLIGAHRAIVVEVFARMVRKETNALRRVAKHGPVALREWIGTFYPEHQATVTAAILPAVRAHLSTSERAEDDPATVAAALAAAFVQAHREQLSTVLTRLANPANLVGLVERTADHWERERPAAMADQLMTEELHHALTA